MEEIYDEQRGTRESAIGRSKAKARTTNVGTQKKNFANSQRRRPSSSAHSGCHYFGDIFKRDWRRVLEKSIFIFTIRFIFKRA